MGGGGGHPGCGHDLFGEGLAALDPGGGGAGAKGGYASGHKGVDDPLGERVIRADHHEVDPLALGKIHQRLEVVQREGDVLAEAACAGVAGHAEQPGKAGRTSDLPGQGVLAAARSDQQHMHKESSWLFLRSTGASIAQAGRAALHLIA